MSSDELRVFELLDTDGTTRHGAGGNVLGWVVAFPEGNCIVEWNRKAWPPDERLDNSHVSQYGSLEDVKEGAGGRLKPLDSHEVTR